MGLGSGATAKLTQLIHSDIYMLVELCTDKRHLFMFPSDTFSKGKMNKNSLICFALIPPLPPEISVASLA